MCDISDNGYLFTPVQFSLSTEISVSPMYFIFFTFEICSVLQNGIAILYCSLITYQYLCLSLLPLSQSQGLISYPQHPSSSLDFSEVLSAVSPHIPTQGRYRSINSLFSTYQHHRLPSSVCIRVYPISFTVYLA